MNKDIFKNNLFQNIGFLSIGSVIAQLISLFGAFYIPKILGPKDYGTLNIVISYVSIFSLLTYQGIDKVLIREGSKYKDRLLDLTEKLFGIKLLASFGAVFITLFCLYFVNYNLTTKYYIFVYSIYLIISTFFSTFNAIYQSKQELKFVAYLDILHNSLITVFSILAVYLGFGVLALIMIRLFSGLVVSFYSYNIIKKRFFRIKISFSFNVSRKFLSQGLNFSIIQFLNTLSGRVDVIMLSFMTSPTEVGIYALSYNIAQKGLIIRKAITQSLFPFYTEKLSKHNIKLNKFVEHTIIIIIPSILMVIFVYVFSEKLIVWILGVEFLQSARILNILIIYLIINYVHIPFGLALQALNREVLIIKLNSIRAAINIIGNIVLFNLFGLIGIAYSTLISTAFIGLSQIYTGYYVVRNHCK